MCQINWIIYTCQHFDRSPIARCVNHRTCGPPIEAIPIFIFGECSDCIHIHNLNNLDLDLTDLDEDEEENNPSLPSIPITEVEIQAFGQLPDTFYHELLATDFSFEDYLNESQLDKKLHNFDFSVGEPGGQEANSSISQQSSHEKAPQGRKDSPTKKERKRNEYALRASAAKQKFLSMTPEERLVAASQHATERERINAQRRALRASKTPEQLEVIRARDRGYRKKRRDELGSQAECEKRKKRRADMSEEELEEVRRKEREYRRGKREEEREREKRRKEEMELFGVGMGFEG